MEEEINQLPTCKETDTEALVNTPVKQPEITNLQPETEAMEVHKHPHHITHTKKWGEYLLEFSMLFLAVFLGFLAEYMLEHRIEKEREKTFITSFYEDLTSDENSLPLFLKSIAQEVEVSDSMRILLHNVNITKPANLIYMYVRRLKRSSNLNLYVNDRTNVQLRNSGGMRLIQNKQMSDSIVAYYKGIEHAQYLYDILVDYKNRLIDAYVPILNGYDYDKVVDSEDRIINPAEELFLRSTDASAINKCLLGVSDIKGISSVINTRVIRIKNRAGNIKKFIANTYGL